MGMRYSRSATGGEDVSNRWCGGGDGDRRWAMGESLRVVVGRSSNVRGTVGLRGNKFVNEKKKMKSATATRSVK